MTASHPIVAIPAGRGRSRFQPVSFRERQHHALASAMGWEADRPVVEGSKPIEDVWHEAKIIPCVNPTSNPTDGA